LHPTQVELVMPPGSVGRKKHMHRSPFLAAALFLFTAAVWAQQPASSEPKDSSGTPQTPMATPQTPNPAPSTAPQTTPAPAQPSSSASPTGSAAANTPNSSSPSTPSQPQLNQNQQPLPTGTANGKAKQDTTASATPPGPPPQPKTEILDSSATSGGLSTNGHDPILDPPPFPSGGTTLVGGIIRDVDRIRNRMVVNVFGGGRWKVSFDERTHIFRNGAETTQLALKKGERVYVDTMLDPGNHDILARNIRVGVAAPPADASGQIMSVDTTHGEVSLRDNINSVPVHFGVDKETQITNGNTPISLAAVKPGALVHVKFSAQGGYRGIAREITVIAMPGAAFTFVGKVAYLDVHRGLLAVQNIDGKTYDIHFSPHDTTETRNLSVGTPVKIVAVFEGSQYTAQSVQVRESSTRSE
jgi:hypothetical protein